MFADLKGHREPEPQGTCGLRGHRGPLLPPDLFIPAEVRSLVPQEGAGSTLFLLQLAFQCPVVLVSVARGPEVMTVPRETAHET